MTQYEHDCASEINKFHDDKVTLSADQQTEMRERRDTNRKRITGYDKTPSVTFKPQGSYKMKTMVQAKENDYDIDDGAYFKEADLQGKTPQGIKAIVKEALTDNSFNEAPKIKNNCVRVNYAVGYHMDIPVYRYEEDASKAELASNPEWIPADVHTVNQWFEEECKQHGDIIRKLVRLTKKFARSRESWVNKMPCGFYLTILVIKAIKEGNAKYYLDEIDKAFYYTLCDIKDYAESNPYVIHPLSGIVLTVEEKEREQIQFLSDKLEDVLSGFDEFTASTDKQDVLRAWENVFNAQNCLCPDGGKSHNENGSNPNAVKKGGDNRYGKHYG